MTRTFVNEDARPGETGGETTCQIIGQDEADATRHQIAPQSPLRRLSGARTDDTFTRVPPSRTLDLETVKIARADP